MSDRVVDTAQNSKSSPESMTDGAEPTDLLLALASSPLQTLAERNAVAIFEAKDANGLPVVVFQFSGYRWQPGAGLVIDDGKALAAS